MIEFLGQEIDKKTKHLLKRIAKQTFKCNGQSFRKIEVGVEFVYDDEIRELNKQTRNIDQVTDVLSFPNLNEVFNKEINKKNFPDDINPENGKIDIGDVVINLNRAQEQAGSFGHSLTREIAYLMVHGLLHLMGYDHVDKLDASLMRAQEETVLAKFNLKREWDMHFKCGFVTILGKPNVGKSTLLNKLVGQKVSIVSPKPQTTRNVVTGILNGQDYQVVFLDTPGIHKVKNSLDEYMEKSIEKSLEGIDLILYMLDGTKKFQQEELEEVSAYANGKTPVIIVVSKVDDSSMDRLYPELAKLNVLDKVKEIIPISSFTGQNLDVLKEYILKFMPECPAMYPTDSVTDSSERFLASEIIREKSLWLLQEEIPHGIAVAIDNFIEVDDLTKIDATIFCEKENHKKIIIGKNGEKLKKIAEESRKAIEKMLGHKVFLTMWVKVKEKWRDSDLLVNNLGYNKKDLD